MYTYFNLLKKRIGLAKPMLTILAFAFISTQSSIASEPMSLTKKNERQDEASTCPYEDFQHFLNAFANSEALQHSFTKDPLKIQSLDLDAEPEPKPVVRLLSHRKIEFPLIPLLTTRTSKSLNLRIDELSQLKAKVTLFKSDSGYQVSYFFHKISCWRLERIEDWSL